MAMKQLNYKKISVFYKDIFINVINAKGIKADFALSARPNLTFLHFNLEKHILVNTVSISIIEDA